MSPSWCEREMKVASMCNICDGATFFNLLTGTGGNCLEYTTCTMYIACIESVL